MLNSVSNDGQRSRDRWSKYRYRCWQRCLVLDYFLLFKSYWGFFFSFRAIKAINIFKILFCDMRVLLHRLYLTWVKTLLFSFCSIHFLLPRTPEIKRKNFEYFTWLIGSLFPICFPHLKFPFLKWQDKQTICHLVWQTKLYEFRYVAYRWREYAHDKPNHPLYITVKGWEGKSAKNKFDDL